MNCEQCGGMVPPRPPARVARAKHHFCSHRCADAFRRKGTPKAERPSVLLVQCEECGKIFSEFPYRAGKRRFCSMACRTANARVRLVCEECGVVFMRPRKWQARSHVFCSKRCYGQAIQRRHGWTEPRQRNLPLAEPRGPNWATQRKGAKRRDGHRCVACGATGVRLDVHHVQPYTQFDGDYAAANRLDNLVTLCRACHVKAERSG